MKIKSSHTCLTIILEDGRKFSLDFEDNFYELNFDGKLISED